MIDEIKFEVTVSMSGENLVTITDDFLSGKAELSEKEAESIRLAGRNLLAFIGDKIDDAVVLDTEIPF